MRLAVLIALLTLALPRATLEQLTQMTYQHATHVATICKRHPESCRAVQEEAKKAGWMMARVAGKAADHVESTALVVLANLELSFNVTEPDRGTLSDQDLLPRWRGE